MRRLTVSAAALSFSLMAGGVWAQSTPLPPVGWAPEGSPVATYGRLKVNGAKVQSVKTNGDVQLRGMSFGWTSDQEAINKPGDFYNERVVAWLVADWRVSLVRAAVGVSDKSDPNNGPFLVGGLPYKGNEASHKNFVKALVNAAIWQGIYVIIDWHSHHAHEGEADNAVYGSKAFFKEMAQIYKDYPNVLYEIYNEPLCQGCWSSVKSYAEGVIDAIRPIDSQNLIIVGTPFYSQRIKDVRGNTITGANRGNIVYTVHFYCNHNDGTGTWDIEFTNSVATVPIFVSEFGLSRDDGTGTCNDNYGSVAAWLNKLDQNKVSWANWQVNNRKYAYGSQIETSSILNMYDTPAERSRLHGGKWTANDLTDRGTWMRSRLRSYDNGESRPNRTYKVDIEVDGEGTVSGNSNIAVCSEATLQATPKPGTGARFEGWIINGASIAANPYKLDVCYDRAGKAVFFPDNLISNSTFTVSSGWAKQPTTGASTPDIQVANGELTFSMADNLGAEPYLVRLQHGSTSLTQGKRYKLTFEARATKTRTITVACRNTSSAPSGHLFNIGEPQITTTKADYELEFDMTAATTTAGVIAFYFGTQQGNVTFDNMKLVEIGNATSALPLTQAAARPFSASFNGKALVLTGGGRSAEVTVYDMAGRARLKRSVQMSSAAQAVSLDNLPSGVYSVRYKADGKTAQGVGRVVLAR